MDELLAFWTFLTFANLKYTGQLQVAGDSKVVVDWFNGVANL